MKFADEETESKVECDSSSYQRLRRTSAFGNPIDIPSNSNYDSDPVLHFSYIIAKLLDPKQIGVVVETKLPPLIDDTLPI